MVQETYFPPDTKRKGSIFLDLTFCHHFSMRKKGQKELLQLLRPYHFGVSSKRMNDFEGFYARMVKRVGVPSRGEHEFDFPEDVMRNEENMTIQANRKSYWKTYEKMLREIH